MFLSSCDYIDTKAKYEYVTGNSYFIQRGTSQDVLQRAYGEPDEKRISMEGKEAWVYYKEVGSIPDNIATLPQKKVQEQEYRREWIIEFDDYDRVLNIIINAEPINKK